MPSFIFVSKFSILEVQAIYNSFNSKGLNNKQFIIEDQQGRDHSYSIFQFQSFEDSSNLLLKKKFA